MRIPSTIKAISLWQPWASLMTICKDYETRSWGHSYRGPLVIHAAKRPMKDEDYTLLWELKEMGAIPEDAQFPVGGIVAITNLTDCFRMESDEAPGSNGDIEEMVGHWEAGRFAWKCENTIAIPYIPYTGSQGLWQITDQATIEALYRAAPAIF